jgi:hypothetical protein
VKTLEYLQDLYKKAVEICSKNRESEMERAYRLVMEKAEKQFSKIKKGQTLIDNKVRVELPYIDFKFEKELKQYFISKGFKSSEIRTFGGFSTTVIEAYFS